MKTSKRKTPKLKLKNMTKLLYVVPFCLLLFCNKGRSASDEVSDNKGDTIVQDTVKGDRVYVIPNYLYLSLDHIFCGESWVNNSNRQFFYRILFSSIEEAKYIHIELIEIPEDGPLRFIKRDKLLPDVFGFDYYSHYPKMISWITPSIVEIEINQESFRLNIKTMVAERIRK